MCLDITRVYLVIYVNMTPRYRVKTVMLSGGERLPMLVDSAGQPLFDPTVYSMTEFRARNRAANTIGNALQALMVFHLFLDLRTIDLDSRLAAGRLLALAEVDDLVRVCRYPVGKLTEMFDEAEEKAHLPASSLEKNRGRQGLATDVDIVPASVATRLRYIRNYLVWHADRRLSRESAGSKVRSALESARQFMVRAINARLPSGNSRGLLGRREGLESSVVARMLMVTNPHSPENPWVDEHSRYRNELIISWLHRLGIRRGELLGIRISNIDFRKGTVVVARNADDPNDPRRYQPNVKTLAREIPLSSHLLDKTYAYIMNHRVNLPGASKHDFLLVASASGAPLSIPSLAKVFNVLRAKCPEMPRSLSAHVLRHTWNDAYSKEMDKRKIPEEQEKKTRSFLMGWSETSASASTYTRRHIRKKAHDASLEMQNQLINGSRPNE